MTLPERVCPDCDGVLDSGMSRRKFLASAGALAVAAGAAPLGVWADEPMAAVAKEAAAATAPVVPETLVKQLFDTFSADQAKKVCFDWDHKDPRRGLLRTHVANNWKVTPQEVSGEFYTKEQQALI